MKDDNSPLGPPPAPFKAPPTPRQIREALSGGKWSYSQMQLFVGEVRGETREAWSWMTPRVREALIAEHAFAVVRAQSCGTVDVKDMDKLLNGMRVIAGLATLDEVL